MPCTKTLRRQCVHCRRLLLVWLLVGPLAAVAFGRGPAVLLDEDFESNPMKTGWTPSGAGTIGKNVFWSATNPHSGKHCLEVKPKPPEKPDAGWESPPFIVTAGSSYRVTFFARSGKPAFWFLMFYDRHGAQVEGDIALAIEPSTNWQRYEGIFRAKFPCHTATFVFCTVGGEPLAVDELKIEACESRQAVDAADRLWSSMHELVCSPPAKTGSLLPRTAKILSHGGPLRVVLLGDSISNDLSNSCYAELVERAFPNVQIESRFTGRGGTGWLKHQFQVEQRLVQHKPDLVVLLAVCNDPDAMSDPLTCLIAQARKHSPQTDILLVTPHLHGWYGVADIGDRQRDVLLRIAAEQKVAILDLQAIWDNYLRFSGKQHEWLLRDGIHMNDRGRQLSARALAAYLQETFESPQ